MQRKLRDNGLSIALFSLFLICVIGQIVTGLHTYNEEQQEHRQQPVGYGEYLKSGHFIEALFENWESEFLQMGVYVILTAFLYQRGSAESKDPDQEEDEEGEPIEPEQKEPGQAEKKAAPQEAEQQKQGSESQSESSPVPRDSPLRKPYEYSLTIAMFSLFFISFALHAVGGTMEYNEQQKVHGERTVSMLEFMGTSEFWFQSFQNWQSEFLSVLSIVVFSIFLRQKGSPESKKVDEPHDKTGNS